jgi:hypothetical protein
LRNALFLPIIFTDALRIYFGIWLTVKLNFGQKKLSRADSSQWANVWFLPGRSRKAEVVSKKLTEREATGGDAPIVYICITGRPLTFPGGDQ